MSMLPDGAETQLDDWTIFFLNQTPFNTISPVLALESPEVKSVGLPGEDGGDGDKPELLCVLNLVRTKHDKSLDRCAFTCIFIPHLLIIISYRAAEPKSLPLRFVLATLSFRYSRWAVKATSVSSL